MSINMLIEYDMVMVCILKDFEIPYYGKPFNVGASTIKKHHYLS